jgi:hypothetical protein
MAIFLFFQFTSLLSDKNRPGQRLSHTGYFIAGSMTGFVVAFVESPIDLVGLTFQFHVLFVFSNNPP